MNPFKVLAKGEVYLILNQRSLQRVFNNPLSPSAPQVEMVHEFLGVNCLGKFEFINMDECKYLFENEGF